MKKSTIAIVIIVVLAGTGIVVSFLAKNNTQDKASQNQPVQQGFNKKQFSLEDPSSLWVIVNKRRPLQPKTHEPSDLTTPAIPLRLAATAEEMQLRKPAADALKTMYDAALADGLKLMVSSAYRSYAYQDNLYKYYVKQQGQAEADTQSARPGHSEHQTGLAVDLEPASRTCEVETCFANTPEGKWVAAHAHTYGFVIRYQEDKQATTGYIYEPWHLRYVGPQLAAELYKQGNPTLEEFFGLAVAPDYR